MPSSNQPVDELSPSDRVRVDELCDQFESDWKSLTRPRVEEYLDGVDARIRSQLLEELVKIDHHWRVQESDPDVIRKEYARRFPGDTNVVKRILDADGGAADHPALLPNSTSLGPFLNLQRIGEGGFGVVFRAWDSRHQRDVALKIPRFGQELTGQELGRFLREAKAAGSLDHQGIARVWDSGSISGITYIAYQFVDGDNLKVRCDEIARWPLQRIITFVRRLAEAVQFAHEHGIVHRDIKPSNILVAADDRPVLTDFGLALATGFDETRSLAARVGTLDYMSPEQASGASSSVDGRTDLWSLGVLTFELLTGERPFHGASDIELLRAVQQDEPRRVRSVRKEIPLDLDVLVTRCLQKRPEDRLSSSGFFAEELARIERSEPIQSRPVSLVERSLRWCGRNRRAVATFAVILLATMFGTWSWSGWLLANRQNENTIQQLQIRLESENARRRELLGVMLQGESGINLSEDDLKYVENRFYTTDNRALRLKAAMLLIEHQRLTPAAFANDDSKHSKRQRCLELLRSLAGNSLDDSLRTKLSIVIDRLK